MYIYIYILRALNCQEKHVYILQTQFSTSTLAEIIRDSLLLTFLPSPNLDCSFILLIQSITNGSHLSCVYSHLCKYLFQNGQGFREWTDLNCTKGSSVRLISWTFPLEYTYICKCVSFCLYIRYSHTQLPKVPATQVCRGRTYNILQIWYGNITITINSRTTV